MAEPAVSVVVATRDRPGHLASCLAALRVAAPAEVVVVDSASRADLAPQVARLAAASGARLLRLEVPGASRARNSGWRVARCDLVAFVDDDVRVGPAWASAMGRALAAPGVSFVAGRTVPPPEQAGTDRPVALLDGVLAGSLDRTSPEPLGASANLGIRRSALAAVGGFDERLGPGTWWRAGEDVELLDRLLSFGFTGWYAPDALAFHDQWRTRRALLALDAGYGLAMGARIALLFGRDVARARRALVTQVWSRGVRTGARDAVHAYEFGALDAGVHTCGVLLGLAVAAGSGLRRRPWGPLPGEGTAPCA